MNVQYISHSGSDLQVVNAARVSFDKESKGEVIDTVVDEPSRTLTDVIGPTEQDKRLIKFLAREGHISPFNHCFITARVKAPIFVARQLVKHKFMPWNEISRRYVDSEPEFYWPTFREGSADKKQGSGGSASEEVQAETWYEFDRVAEAARNAYSNALERGVCEEQARVVLPLNMYTEWYWSGTLGAWTDMYNLRAKPDTQLETQEIARMTGDIIQPLFPESWEALTA